VWWTFWTGYLSAVFQPWWTAARVPVHIDPAGLGVSAGQPSLDQVLQAWTLHEPGNPAFTPPGQRRRTAPAVMRSAFSAAVARLRATVGGRPASWAWGRLHSRTFPSLTKAAGLGYGPRPAGGDPWTVDAADGGMAATQGPSWRMIMQLGGRRSGAGAARGGPGPARGGDVVGQGIYPGGQSENPASPWYADQVSGWWNGDYLPMPQAGRDAAGPIRWKLRPAGVRPDGGS